MIDVDQLAAQATAEAKQAGCTCDVLVEIDLCEGDGVHPEHVTDIRRLHLATCWLMLRAWYPWN